MASRDHMASPEDDAPHKPGPNSLPLWNESYWFSFYDSASDIGLTARLGAHPNIGEGNLYVVFTQDGRIVHSLGELRGPVPSLHGDSLGLHGYRITLEKPLERFRLQYQAENHAMDVVWEGMSPTYVYPHPPGSSHDQYSRHIEHAGRVTGAVTLGGGRHDVDCFGHRDHSWGGERDWAKMNGWDYLSGEFGPDFWFNAVRVSMVGMPQDLYMGCVWDGEQVMPLPKIEMDVRRTDGGTRQLGVDLRMTDELGREHHVIGEQVLAVAPAWFNRTGVRDGFTRYRYGERVGYGILELGYTERDE